MVVWGFGVLVALESGCVGNRPAESPPEGTPVLPETWSESISGTPVSSPWWEMFGANDLDALTREALRRNFTVGEAWSRLAQVEALARQAGAARYPWLGGEASASRTESRGPIPGGGEGTLTVDQLFLGLTGSYEVDLWGRIRSQTEAAQASSRASRYDVESAATSVAAQVVSQWALIVAQRAKLNLLLEQGETNRTVLELIQLRFRTGLGTALDIRQQEQAVAQVRSLLPLEQARLELAEHQLALLLGRPPDAPAEVVSETLPDLPPLPVLGLPVDLLAQRPDIRAARERLRSSEWRVVSAEADRLPAIRLTGRIGYSSAEWDRALDDWMWNLAGGIAGPIFEGGRRQAEVDRARAEAMERITAYRRTVATAARDVEDALARERRQVEHLDALGTQITASQAALDEATLRYRNGLIDYLPVLTQLVNTQGLRRERIDRTRELIEIRVGLYRALGGAWTEALEPPPAQPMESRPNE